MTTRVTTIMTFVMVLITIMVNSFRWAASLTDLTYSAPVAACTRTKLIFDFKIKKTHFAIIQSATIAVVFEVIKRCVEVIMMVDMSWQFRQRQMQSQHHIYISIIVVLNIIIGITFNIGIIANVMIGNIEIWLIVWTYHLGF